MLCCRVQPVVVKVAEWKYGHDWQRVDDCVCCWCLRSAHNQRASVDVAATVRNVHLDNCLHNITGSYYCGNDVDRSRFNCERDGSQVCPRFPSVGKNNCQARRATEAHDVAEVSFEAREVLTCGNHGDQRAALEADGNRCSDRPLHPQHTFSITQQQSCWQERTRRENACFFSD